MSGQASPFQITDALQAATGAQGVGAPGNIEPADVAHINMTDYLQPASPSSESEFMSISQAPAIHDVHAATPEMRASAPTEANEILNNLGQSLEQVTNTMNSSMVPDMPTKMPGVAVKGAKFDPASIEKMNDEMMKQQSTLFNSVFVADERLQSATMGETMIANSATQVEKSMKQLLNGQG